ncbi:MAG: hypothetical protein MUP80_03675 [Acidobacteriia bacterium]|nr:hypothetical protein [Terriglobia bacterium]
MQLQRVASGHEFSLPRLAVGRAERTHSLSKVEPAFAAEGIPSGNDVPFERLDPRSVLSLSDLTSLYSRRYLNFKYLPRAARDGWDRAAAL